MALQLSFNAPIGVTFATAYAKVKQGSWDGATGIVSANVEVYATKAASDLRNADGSHVNSPIAAMSVSFPLDLNSTMNVVAQTYAFIKTRPEFAGAVDV